MCPAGMDGTLTVQSEIDSRNLLPANQSSPIWLVLFLNTKPAAASANVNTIDLLSTVQAYLGKKPSAAATPFPTDPLVFYHS